MTAHQYLALLRGINVGGNNLIKMADLKTLFLDLGFAGVGTYIQSGNVWFSSPEAEPERLIDQIEAALSAKFDYCSRIVLVSHEQLRGVVEDAPPGYGEQPEEYRYDVWFLKAPFSVGEALQGLKIREGVDRVIAGQTVLYGSRLISQAGQSYLAKVISQPIYQKMTIRNWNTTTKLLALMNAQIAT